MLTMPSLYVIFAIVLILVPVYSGFKGIDNKMG